MNIGKESENIEKVIHRLTDCDADVDYLVVNDCSTDQTEEILEYGQMTGAGNWQKFRDPLDNTQNDGS